MIIFKLLLKTVILLLTIVILVLISHITDDDIQVAAEDSHITVDHCHIGAYQPYY
jgi:hypothetical protein